ncbi:MAG: hydrogenase nickel incorporation protein HypB [Ignavibacteriales bacterium]
MSTLTIERKILEKNDKIAQELREEFKQNRIFVMNLMSAPGSGKTSIIENITHYFSGHLPTAVIAGDVQTDNDSRRIERSGIPVIQIVTNGECHLEANLVRDAFRLLPVKDMRLLIIENVGNLICPAGFDLGESIKAVILSVTEGEDKPLKYPAMFRNASLLIINKIDLLPHLNCSIDEIRQNATTINPSLTIIETSCKTGEGIGDLCNWIQLQIK